MMVGRGGSGGGVGDMTVGIVVVARGRPGGGGIGGGGDATTLSEISFVALICPRVLALSNA